MTCFLYILVISNYQAKIPCGFFRLTHAPAQAVSAALVDQISDKPCHGGYWPGR